MCPNRNYLFNDAYINEFFQQKKGEIKVYIYDIAEENILNSDSKQLSEELTQNFMLIPLSIQKDDIKMETEEISSKKASHRSKAYRIGNLPSEQKVTSIRLHIPYLGDENLFNFIPSKYNNNPPRGDVEDDRIVLEIISVQSELSRLKSEVEYNLQNLDFWLLSVEEDVKEFNNSIHAEIFSILSRRRSEINQKRKVFEEIGFPETKFIEESREKIENRPVKKKSDYEVKSRENFEYDIVLSYAGENRDYVEKVAKELKRLGVHVFYDKDEEVKLWGKDLAEHFDILYREKARFCVMFISEHYAKKMWTIHERKSAISRAINQTEEYILPVKFDETDIPGLQPTISYKKAEDFSPEELAQIIKEKSKEID